MVDDDPAGGGGWAGDELAAALARWAADAAVAEAAGTRTRERWLRQQAGETATLTGVLVDLAERATPAVVTLRSGVHRGRVVGVGRDFCVLASRASVVVALDAVVSVAAGPASVAERTGTDGDRVAPLDLDLTDVLSLLSADRSPARLALAGGAIVAGSLLSAGAGVVECRTASPGGRTVVVVVSAIEACTPG